MEWCISDKIMYKCIGSFVDMAMTWVVTALKIHVSAVKTIHLLHFVTGNLYESKLPYCSSVAGLLNSSSKSALCCTMHCVQLYNLWPFTHFIKDNMALWGKKNKKKKHAPLE